MLSSLERSILQTVCYADVFDFALSPMEICQFLMTKKHYRLNEVISALSHISSLKKQDGLVYLKGRKKLVELRKKLRRISTGKMRRARATAKLFRWIPTISAIYVTGGTAIGNVREDDDIDFMVVTKPGWLWTTRCLIVLISSLLGVYRSRRMESVKNRWCFNLWLDETALELPPGQRNIYTAHEVVQAKPVFDRGGIATRFLAENIWVKNFLAHAADWESFKNVQRFSARTSSMNILESFCYAIQRRHMQSARTRERIGPSFAFFHPRNTSGMVMKKFKERVKTYGA